MTAKEPVTVADMVGDLISSEHFTAVDMNSTREPKSIRKEEVLGSLVHFGNQNGEECISVLNVAAHTAQRRGVRYPADISPKKTDILHWNGTPQTRLDWVICPRGAITGSHIDEYTMRSWIWHWKGKKLWFAWPGSATNLEKYLSYLFNSTEEMNIARAIQEFENMEVLLLDDNDEGFSWVFCPGVIHAVMTFSQAGHLGFFFVNRNDQKGAHSIADTIIRTLTLLDDDDFSAAKEEIDATVRRLSNADIPAWSALAQKLTSKRKTSEASKIKRWIQDLEGRLKVYSSVEGLEPANQHPRASRTSH